MRVLILRSKGGPGSGSDPYSVRMDTQFADRVLSHLENRPGYCQSCQKACKHCRDRYSLDFGANLTQIAFPANLPFMLDDPDEFLPAEIPKHDVLLAISVHEEILEAFLKACHTAKAVIVPRENLQSISPNAIVRISDFCREKGIETAFPKPFCSFDPRKGYLKGFSDFFRIGKPGIKLVVEEGVIRKATVKRSAPCGATYYVARGLEGHSVEERLDRVAVGRLSAYPCTASTEVDAEFGDSITHEASKILAATVLSIA